MYEIHNVLLIYKHGYTSKFIGRLIYWIYYYCREHQILNRAFIDKMQYMYPRLCCDNFSSTVMTDKPNVIVSWVHWCEFRYISGKPRVTMNKYFRETNILVNFLHYSLNTFFPMPYIWDAL